MAQAGVRELKNNLSSYLRRVRGGEEVQVMLRGEHVADLVPAGEPGGDWRRALIADGRLTPPRERHTTRAPRPAKLGRSLSDRLLDEREEEDR